MAEKRTSSTGEERSAATDKGLRQDPVVRKLIRNPAAGIPDRKVFRGLLGRGAQDGLWRLYFDLEFDEYIEFRDSDVVLCVSLRTDERPLAGSVVWLNADAKIQNVTTDQGDARSDFLQGEIADRFLAATEAQLPLEEAQARAQAFTRSVFKRCKKKTHRTICGRRCGPQFVEDFDFFF